MILLTLFACNGDADDSAAPASLPDFNYIPINDDSCSAFSDAYEADAVNGVLTDIVDTNSHFAAEALEVCSPDMVSDCAACSTEENPLIGALDTMAGADGTAAMSDYFRKALSYPYRFAVVSTDLSAESGSLVLSQAVGEDCEWNASTEHVVCSTYILQPESLDETCQQPALSFAVARSEADDVTSWRSSTLTDGRAFGFYVPLMAELPDPAEFETDAEMQRWVQTQPKVAVSMEYPSIEINVAQDGAACGRLTGYVRAGDLAAFALDPDALAPFVYVDPTGKVPEGYIQAVLALDLDGSDLFTANSEEAR